MVYAVKLYPVESQKFIECTQGICVNMPKHLIMNFITLEMVKEFMNIHCITFTFFALQILQTIWQVPADLASLASQQIISFGQEFTSERDKCIEHLDMFKVIR